MSSILSFSHYTTKYNIEQLFSAGHPLNISLFSNKDRTSASFVAVTSCDGRGWSAHYRRETETQQKLVRLCWLRVDVACCVCCHCKINIGRSKWKKKKVKEVCGVPTEMFTKRWLISSQFHGLLVWHHEFRWEYRGKKQQINWKLSGPKHTETGCRTFSNTDRTIYPRKTMFLQLFQRHKNNTRKV